MNTKGKRRLTRRSSRPLWRWPLCALRCAPLFRIAASAKKDAELRRYALTAGIINIQYHSMQLVDFVGGYNAISGHDS